MNQEVTRSRLDCLPKSLLTEVETYLPDKSQMCFSLAQLQNKEAAAKERCKNLKSKILEAETTRKEEEHKLRASKGCMKLIASLKEEHAAETALLKEKHEIDILRIHSRQYSGYLKILQVLDEIIHDDSDEE